MKRVQPVLLIVMSDSQVENLDAVIDHLTDSMELAMEAEDIDEETRNKIIDTVGEAAGNNSEVLLPYIKNEPVE